MAKPEDYESCFEALTLINQCIPGLAPDAKKLQEKLAKRKKADAKTGTTSKDQRRKRATAANKWVMVLETELLEAIDARARLVDNPA